ncbi:unnamed protein product [Urochloa humidicola]
MATGMTTKLRERRQLSLSVVPPAAPAVHVPGTPARRPVAHFALLPRPGHRTPSGAREGGRPRPRCRRHGLQGAPPPHGRGARGQGDSRARRRRGAPQGRHALSAWLRRRPTTCTSSASTASSPGPTAATSSCASSSRTSNLLVGVVHGDVKPSNLLVGRHGEVKIADFGASRHVSTVRAAGGRRCCGDVHVHEPGPPERLDPEGFRFGFGAAPPSAAVDFAGDVWALGVVLLECHVGRYPLVAAGERPGPPYW